MGIGGNMAKKKQEKVVSSRIEITKSNSNKVGETAQVASLKQYRKQIADMTTSITKFALKQSDNLLSVKMALMGAMREVEIRLRKNKEG